MKKYVFTILILAFSIVGCAKIAKIKSFPSPEDAISGIEGQDVTGKIVSKEIKEPEPFFVVGERFTYLVAWKGIPVGTATATIEELTTFNGYQVYKIVVIAKTNDYLSKIFKVEDTFISYLDKNEFVSRHYEAIQREGKYKKDLVVDYDFQKRIAIYKNLRDGTIKTCPIEKNVHDPVSAAYFFRTMPVSVGDEIKISVNLNEKNYEVLGNINKRATVTLPEIGTFEAFLIKPYVKLEGKRQRRANVWGYFSSDKRRLGLCAALKVLEIPWIGEVTATLEKVEYKGTAASET